MGRYQDLLQDIADRDVQSQQSKKAKKASRADHLQASIDKQELSLKKMSGDARKTKASALLSLSKSPALFNIDHELDSAMREMSHRRKKNLDYMRHYNMEEESTRRNYRGELVQGLTAAAISKGVSSYEKRQQEKKKKNNSKKKRLTPEPKRPKHPKPFTTW